ncbi:acyltransferase family protein, partial [Neobacillus sp. YIM B02564]|nr:acyltransferase family protein [Neobacillus paridis]
TWVVMAGVTWSLPYEWFFYFALPVMAFTVRSVPPAPFLLASLSSIAFAYTYGLENHHLLAFGGGIFAALVNRSNTIRTIGRSWLAPLVVVACFVSVVALFPTAYGYPQLMLISVAFTLIAAGCSLYGIFTNSVSKALGEMAYSIYLLHGIFLFTVIDLIVGRENVAQMSPLAYWLLIVTMTPLMILG